MIDTQWVKKQRWFHFEDVYDCPMWLLWAPMHAYPEELEKEFGTGVFDLCFLYEEGKLHMYFHADQYERAGQHLMEQIITSPVILKNILDRIETCADEVFALSRNIRASNFSGLSDADLIQTYKNFYASYDPMWVYGQAVNLLEHGNSYVLTYLRDLLREQGVSSADLESVVECLTKPEQWSMSQKEEYDLLCLARDGWNEDTLLKHTGTYAFLGYGWSGPGWDVAYFRGRLEALQSEDLVSIEDEKTFCERIHAEKKQCVETFGLDDRTQEFAKLVEGIIFLKGYRIDASYCGYWGMETLFREIARRQMLSLRQVQYIMPYEIDTCLQEDGIDVDKLNARHLHGGFIYKDGVLHDVTGSGVTEHIRVLQEDRTVDLHVQELHGECGSPGVAVGRVCIIRRPEEMDKMKEGDILVSHATDPRFVPAMKKASAVIAEVGGIVCHAAIVARELGIPCVIGTKIATKVLKDGDMVEVDAGKGIVKKL